jgi:hypothetical protein
MEPIHQFIQDGKNLCVPILINSCSRLSMLELNKGEITFDDIMESISSASEALLELSNDEKKIYAGILYESVLRPAYKNRKPALAMKKELIGDDERCLKSILFVLKENQGGGNVPDNTLRNFVEDMEKMLPVLRGREEFDRRNSFSLTLPPASEPSIGELKQSIFDSADFDLALLNNPDDSTPVTTDTTTTSNQERNPGLVRFLAYIRKGGMDILFPQLIHDKVSG